MTRNEWTAALAKLTQPEDAVRAAGTLRSYLQLLSDLPDEAFTQASLEAVAAACRRFPSYGELRTALGAWWKAHRPILAALPAPRAEERAPPTDAERAYVAERVREIRGILGT